MAMAMAMALALVLALDFHVEFPAQTLLSIKLRIKRYLFIIALIHPISMCSFTHRKGTAGLKRIT